jgi:hypothetical protein
MNKETITIKALDSGWYKLELTDKYGTYVGVCEQSVEDCMKYAENYFAGADERKRKNDSWGKCVQQLVEADRKAGRSWE